MTTTIDRLRQHIDSHPHIAGRSQVRRYLDDLDALVAAAARLRRSHERQRARTVAFQTWAAAARNGGPKGPAVIEEIERAHPVAWSFDDDCAEILRCLARIVPETDVADTIPAPPSGEALTDTRSSRWRAAEARCSASHCDPVDLAIIAEEQARVDADHADTAVERAVASAELVRIDPACVCCQVVLDTSDDRPPLCEDCFHVDEENEEAIHAFQARVDARRKALAATERAHSAETAP